jgi:hypothetical protein
MIHKESMMWKVQGTLQRNDAKLNPAHRPLSPEYAAYTSQLLTVAEIERHEQRIYQPGYTPTAIRENIRKILNESNPNQHMVNFQETDIPPPDRGMRIFRVLRDLLEQRETLNNDFCLDVAAIASNGNPLSDNDKRTEEYALRDQQHNRVNRRMYRVYAVSAYIIHDRNFRSYCRPALRHLPEATAFKLAVLKERLQQPVQERPEF